MDTTALYLARHVRRLETEAARALAPCTLMLRAADQAFQWIQKHHPQAAVAVLCGPGNNGGDGWALASRLYEAGRDVHVFSITPADSMPDDARHCRAAAPSGLTVHTQCPAPQAPAFGLIVDALFGLGLSRPISAPYTAWIDWANQSAAYRLALDLPSGLAADTGRAQAPCFRADATLTFLTNKPGLHTADGVDHAGEVTLHTLSVHNPLPPDGVLLTARQATALFPARRRNSHKGSHGTLAVVGGQAGMEGAALLAARTALLSGSGKVFLGWTQDASETMRVDPLHPELMLRPIDALLAQHAALGINSWAIGCGMGMTDAAQDWLSRLLALTAQHALVLDADALNLIAQTPGVPPALLDRAQPAVLTPHPLEAARLLRCTVKDVEADRIAAAVELARRFYAVAVLKGAGTVLADPQGQWAINTSGNPGLASAGTGDVLSGLIGSLAAQGLAPWDAARAGVWLHGAAADHCVAHGIGPIGLRATDLQPALRQLLNPPVPARHG